MTGKSRKYQTGDRVRLKKGGIKILSFFLTVVLLFSANLALGAFAGIHAQIKGQVSGFEAGKVHAPSSLPFCPEPIQSEETTDGETNESLESSDDDHELAAFFHLLFEQLGERYMAKIPDNISGIFASIPFFILFHSWKGFLN